jgi:hypothetical protein
MTCFEPLHEETIISNPVVAAALGTTFLEARAIPGPPLTDRLKELAYLVFKTLVTAGEDLDPDEIQRWARQVAALEPADAEALAEIAEAVRDGWTMRTSSYDEITFGADILEQWRQEARKDE